MAGAIFGEVGVTFRGRRSICVQFLGDRRSANFFHTNSVSKMGRVRSPKLRVRDDDFILGSCSEYPRIVVESSVYWRKQFKDFSLNLELYIPWQAQ